MNQTTPQTTTQVLETPGKVNTEGMDENSITSTVQTGQRKPYFEMAMDDTGKWHWMLWSGNGRQLAINALAYDRRNDCLQAVKAVIAGITSETKVVIARN